ncbi:hydroxymethylglutaryl-CoA lyase [Flavobacteriaceae bacterium]|jgi:hydroxymethylglutaryl-CoA lyase|nr:hydroxymethylglutaryl-CoA lyase [Flavobacteriaceae bacterium]MDA7716512.1 hydroxymethylglutaryl-CoA lyase [Flavobacteriaceae bacterium]MDA7730822.1 hydroxymethylglutaryl-CoA lyase [Flavobacteriaceae bacterium]MDA9001669.1 hydroxymethylglutaryl-CoA lyase [Flavobacteriaceae bacterium]MDA9616908.1 hydroxymethylglutaryl-CoA lyase [Flavobacteriaceae bacterium]
MSSIKIVECPRDAMQGIKQWIPSEIKLDYLQSVLSVGFDVVDFGSFVSKRAIPQMSDSAYIIDQLDLSNTTSKLLAIVANERGALDACSHSSLSFLGFPFSISEIFQMRNTNKSINESFEELKKIKTISEKYSKNLVVYLSMGFGNPYGEPWNYEIVEKWIDKLSDLKIQVISLSDTIGTAVPDDIFRIFSNIIPKYTQVEFGAHFHTKPDDWFKKIDSAYRAGCKRFDGAIQGFGGCPMAKDELTGNLPTEKLISYFNTLNKKTSINSLNFESCYNHALRLFNDFK